MLARETLLAAELMASGSDVTVSQVIHDLQARASYVTLVWDGRPDKKLGLPIPFGTKIEDVHNEAAKAIKAFQSELATATVKVP